MNFSFKKVVAFSSVLTVGVSSLSLGIHAEKEVYKIEPENVQKYCSFTGGYGLDENGGIYEGFIDISDSDLSDIDLLSYIGFHDYTILPDSDKLPKGFDKDQWYKDHQYPGMGISALHKKGINGKGVNVAVCDKLAYWLQHPEYKDKIKTMKNFIDGKETSEVGSLQHFHPSYVLSPFVGKNCGVAPGVSNVYFGGNDDSYKDRIVILKWIIEENKKLPKEEKIKVFSMSSGVVGSDEIVSEWKKTITQAEADGIMVITSQYGPGPGNTVSPGLLDVNNPDDLSKCYIYFTNHNEANANAPGMLMNQKEIVAQYGVPEDFLIVPSGMHTVAFEEVEGEYQYAYNLPAVSLSVPTLAGIATLGFQIDPDLTPNQVKEFLLATRTDNYVVNPSAFVKKVMENKLGEEIPDKVFEAIDSPIVKIMTDEKTGVKVYLTEKTYTDGITLSVEQVDKDHADFGTANANTDSSTKDGDDRFTYYNISLKTASGTSVSLAGNIAVMFPIPSNFDKSEKDLSVYWVSPDVDKKYDTENNITELNGKSYYMFTTDHLSTWTLVDENKPAGFNIHYLLGGICVGIGVIILVLKARKKKSSQ